MLLAIDAGNSNIVVGLFRDDRLVARWRAATAANRTADDLASLLLVWLAIDGHLLDQIEGVCVASVVPPLDDALADVARRHCARPPLFVSSQLDLGVRIRVDRPHEVGADRLANAAAAYALYGGPCLVVDLGTATKFEAVTAGGDYLGGAIAPGIDILRDALGDAAPALAPTELTPPHRPIGKSTPQAVASGLNLGYVGLVEGMIARIRQTLGPQARTIATGGLASLVAARTTAFDHLHPSLTLDGLRLIWERNR